jgi:predicted RNase H-like nuclease (RuvC/YqgF family)
LVEPDQNEANGKPPGPVEDLAGGAAEDTAEVEVGQGETSDPEELKARLGIKNNHIRELFEQITSSRLAAEEARASSAASEGHIASLERERARLKERIRDLEKESRGRRRRREGLERQVARLQREIERKDGELARRDYLLKRRAEEIEDSRLDTEQLAARRTPFAGSRASRGTSKSGRARPPSCAPPSRISVPTWRRSTSSGSASPSPPTGCGRV